MMGTSLRSITPAALLLALAACGRVAAEDREGDFLLVTIDTLRADFVSAYGAPFESTPHIDRLAREGVILTDHHAVISLTAPSHLSMFTGLLPTEHGLRRNGPRFPDELTYLPEVLARAGYRTLAVMGSSILRRKAGFARGFEVFDDELQDDAGAANFGAGLGTVYERDARTVIDRALELLDDDDERPTFLWVHLYDPHEPYRAPAEWLRDEAQAREGFSAQIETNGRVDADTQLAWRRGYEAEVRYSDHHLGRLLEAWDRRAGGRLGLVIVTSDHGQGLGEHDYNGHGFYIYQEQLQVPFVARMRGRLPAERRVDAPTAGLDLARTVVDLLDLDATGIRGRSLAPLLTGETSQGRPALLAERREWTEEDIQRQGDVQRLVEGKAGEPGGSHAEQIALVRRPWKFLWTADGGRELYDLERDPAESHNRAADEPELVTRFTTEIEVWRASVEAGSVDEELSEETLRMLQSLGY